MRPANLDVNTSFLKGVFLQSRHWIAVVARKIRNGEFGPVDENGVGVMNKGKSIMAFALILLWLTVLCGDALAEKISLQRRLMGTVVNIVVWHDVGEEQARAAIQSAFEEIERVEGLFSIYRESTPVSRINAAAGKQPVQVPQEVMRMLRAGADFAGETDGAFDPTFAT